MSDLISREKAIDAVYERIREIGYEHNQSVRSIIQAIRDLPSAEQAKRGKWINTHEKDEWYCIVYKCSVCGYKTLGKFDKFCGRCGARMDKDE